MSDLQPQIVRIANKLKQLLKQQEQLKKENDKLRAGLAAKEQELLQAKDTIAQMEEKLAVLKASAGRMDEKSKQQFEKKIAQYIRDIDKVIVHLNR